MAEVPKYWRKPNTPDWRIRDILEKDMLAAHKRVDDEEFWGGICENLHQSLDEKLGVEPVDDWLVSMKTQLRLLREDKYWWPKGEDNFKQFMLELTQIIIDGQRKS